MYWFTYGQNAQLLISFENKLLIYKTKALSNLFGHIAYNFGEQPVNIFNIEIFLRFQSTDLPLHHQFSSLVVVPNIIFHKNLQRIPSIKEKIKIFSSKDSTGLIVYYSKWTWRCTYLTRKFKQFKSNDLTSYMTLPATCFEPARSSGYPP